ncbi:hypothetical protein [Novosphingobium sp. BL-52-GroH]|uniref:hypothetical protein n=1 Tax=Novosphingobium sp. BL-52-GroH TaxID=3349877 RepID=UPI00384B370D
MMDDTQHNWLSIPARRDIVAQLDRIALPADAKVILERLLDTTVTVGTRVLAIGRQVLAFAFDMVKRFRGIAFGALIAVTVSSLIASTPLVGGALAALLAPLLLAFGLTLGALEDLRNGALREPLVRFGTAITDAAHG